MNEFASETFIQHEAEDLKCITLECVFFFTNIAIISNDSNTSTIWDPRPNDATHSRIVDMFNFTSVFS